MKVHWYTYPLTGCLTSSSKAARRGRYYISFFRDTKLLAMPAKLAQHTLVKNSALNLFWKASDRYGFRYPEHYEIYIQALCMGCPLSKVLRKMKEDGVL